jgi:hypothetical protein
MGSSRAISFEMKVISGSATIHLSTYIKLVLPLHLHTIILLYMCKYCTCVMEPNHLSNKASEQLAFDALDPELISTTC